MTPDGLTARISWSPNAAGSGSSDKGSSGASASAKNSGYDVTLTATDALHGVEGLTLYGGLSQTEQQVNLAAYDDDATEQTVGAKYAAGSFTLGYQWSEDDLGRATGTTEYENNAYGITFSVNDDLSIGYNHMESEASGGSADVEVSSVQIAYTMGGASIRLAEASADNMKYQTAAANDRDATTISVSLAF